MNRGFVVWVTALLLAWNGMALIPTNSSSREVYKQSSPKVRHSDSLPRVTLAARQTTNSASLRRRGAKDIGNIIYSSVSADLWIISDQCQTAQCKGNPSYPLLTYTSPSFHSVNDNQTIFNISFADSTGVSIFDCIVRLVLLKDIYYPKGASGFVAKETVQVDSLAMPNQTLGLVNSTNVNLGPSVSGVFGLGFSRLSQISSLVPEASPFVPALVERGVLDYPLVGLSLTYDTSGTLSFGAIDKSVVPNVSLISWHAVEPFSPLPGQNASTTPLYLDWVIPLDGIVVNGTNLPLHSSFPTITGKNPLGLLDVGFTGISGPYEDVAAIFFQLDTIRQASPGVWAVPGTNVTLQPIDFLIGPTEGDPNLCLSWPIAQIPPDDDGVAWHFGTPFLRTVYTIFSYGVAGKEPPLIGLYPLHNSTTFTGNATILSSAFSSLSATVETTLPPVLLPTPTLVIPSYIFNTSVTPLPTFGQILPIQSDDGNSSYTPLFTRPPDASPGVLLLTNVSALPTIAAPPSVSTVVITDALGATHTSTSTLELIPTRILGLPPGEYTLNSANSLLKLGGLAWTFTIIIALKLCPWT
ncbi:hypothetical protein Clacol_002908 [Clathrus columnatus]|uniref:Peptidase A1 domain-containing protein n=1 Tax=Clathrus columnatus TaxID=1419009 RepID=A0AAV5A626_9AGAM|nr:hypothetical protein Clacol_002908 [Clathrus columnatus]